MEDKQLDSVHGKKLSEFNDAEARGWIINRMGQIELTINRLITEFFKPEDEHKFKEILLNSAVINMGSKLKILSSCDLLDEATIGRIRELNSIRNGFAHAVFIPTSEIMIDKENERSELLASYHSLKVMNSQGEVKSKKVHEHLEKFYQLYKKVKEAL